MKTVSPLVSLLPSREKVGPKGSDEGAHRRATQPVATASSRLNHLGAPSSGASRHLLPRGEKGALTAASAAGIF